MSKLVRKLIGFTIKGQNGSATKNGGKLSVTTNPKEFPAFLKLPQKWKDFTNKNKKGPNTGHSGNFLQQKSKRS